MRRLTQAALSAWNELHPTVAATLGGLACAAVLAWTGQRALAENLDFTSILMRGLLPFLLFAGALHIDVPGLKQEGGFIALLSTAGVVIATLFVGFALRLALGLPLPICLL